MRFQTFGAYPAPTPPPAAAMVHAALNGDSTAYEIPVESGQLWNTIQAQSGASGIIVEGGSDAKTISLDKLHIGWGGVSMAGRVEISVSEDRSLSVLFQSAPSGFLVVPYDLKNLLIGTYGLRCANNSTDGEYSITVYYEVVKW